MYCLDKGESYLPDKQTSLEDRYYNNHSFQQDYEVNDPDVNNAATKIQAKFRGHKARQDVEKMKHDKEMIDTDQQELGYGRGRSTTPKDNEHQAAHGEHGVPHGEHRAPAHGDHREPHGEHRAPAHGDHREPHGEHRAPAHGDHREPHGEHRAPAHGDHREPHGEHRAPAHGDHREPHAEHGVSARGEHRVPHDEHGALHEDHHKSSHPSNARPEKHEYKDNAPQIEPDEQFNEEITEEEKQEQDRAARSIQARFRGQKLRKGTNQGQVSPGSVSDRDQPSDRSHHQDSDRDKVSARSSPHPSERPNSARHDHLDKSKDHHQTETGKEHDTDRPRLHREPSQLSEDFERHTEVPRDSDFNREHRPDLNNQDDDMSDPNLDKAATRIQASFRGYKTRKELGTGGSQDQQPSATSSHAHDDYDHAHKNILSSSAAGNKEPEGEEDDKAAAIKIQAAYRGYRVRKDLEK